MKAIVQNGYGSTEHVSVKEVERPRINDDQVLVKVRASSVNAGDLFTVKGSPAIAKASTVLIMAIVLLVRPAGIFGKKE